jgi:hypothetical protein
MGVSTDAIVFYGYCWDDECRLLPEGSDEWTAVVLRGRGVRRPWDDFPKELNDPSHPQYVHDYDRRKTAADQWTTDHRAELDEWYAANRAAKAEFGCDTDTHCSGDYPIPYVFVVASRVSAARGHPRELDPATVAARPEWGGMLDRFLAALAVERPHPEPKWWLVSYWG